MRKISRRELLKTMGALALSLPLLQACGTPEPEPEPDAPDETMEAPPEPETYDLSVATWTDAVRTWMDEKSLEWAEENPNVNLTIEQIPYNEMAQAQLTGIATGTLQDVVFSGLKWMHYSAFKGAFLALDGLVEADDPGMDDFLPAAVEGCTLDGKLYALPFETNTGNTNIFYYNKTMLQEKGVELPTDDWTIDEFLDKALAVNDPDNRIFGLQINTSGNYYDLACWTRSWGQDIFDAEKKEFILAGNADSEEATKWLTELRTVHGVAPSRAEAEGLDWNAGQIGFFGWGTYGVGANNANIGDTFEWDAVLAPKSPKGLRGYELFATVYGIYAKTEQPEGAYSLLKKLTSEETAMYSFINQGQPPARTSVFESQAAADYHPIYPRVGAWLADGVNMGPFPMPDNLRFAELNDVYKNYAEDIFFGDVDFDAGIQTLTDECNKIMAQPRG
jgi:multiple sugar transport system substrate-binding protein